jgi:exopolysaccharide biosynthesis protein
MQLGREYNGLANVLRFNPKEESVQFEQCEDGLCVAGLVCIKGNLQPGKLAKTSSVFGLKEDGSPFIGIVNELEEATFILKGNPRIVHKGELNVNTVNEETDKGVVYSVQPRLGVGHTNDGEVIIVAPVSELTVKQLGQLMLELGCVEAINVYGKNVGEIEYKGIPAEEAETKSEETVEEKKPTTSRKKRTRTSKATK